MIIILHGYRKKKDDCWSNNAPSNKPTTKVPSRPFDLGWQNFAIKIVKCLARWPLH
jgi:hypothetical protein